MSNIIDVPISDIILDPRLQMRETMNFAIIDEYAEAIFDLPPAKIVMGEGGNMWLTDGWHSYHAHVKSKQEEMKCSVRDGSFLDALSEAAGANHAHGLRRTTADKRRAVKAILSDPILAQRSDRAIAHTCKVSHPLVATIRKELESDSASSGNSSTSNDENERKVAETTRPVSQPKPTQHTENKEDEGIPDFDTPKSPAKSTVKGHTKSNGKPKNVPEATPGDDEDEMVDDAGFSVPGRLRAIFASKDAIKSAAVVLARAATIAREAEETTLYVEQCKTHNDRLKYSTVLMTGAGKFRDLEPSLVHQECAGNGCKDCRGFGYLTADDAKAVGNAK